MKLNGYLVPGLIGLGALAAIWYIARMNTAAAASSSPASSGASTAGNDTISPAAAAGATPGSVVSPGNTSTGTSSYQIPNNFGITGGSNW